MKNITSLIVLLSLFFVFGCSDDDNINSLNQVGTWEGYRFSDWYQDGNYVKTSDTSYVSYIFNADGSGEIVHINQQITNWEIREDDEIIMKYEIFLLPDSSLNEITQGFEIITNDREIQKWVDTLILIEAGTMERFDIYGEVHLERIE